MDDSRNPYEKANRRNSNQERRSRATHRQRAQPSSPAPLGASELSMQTVSQNGDTTSFSSHAARSHSKHWLRASQARADGRSLLSWRTSTTRQGSRKWKQN